VRAAVLVSMPKDAGYILDSYLLALDLDEPTARRVREKFAGREGRLASSISALPLAPKIHCPLLLVHDRNDGIVPVAHAEEIAQLLPDGKLLLTREQGHSAMLRDESTIGAAMGFLDEVLK
jgi:pimeloyl-ACP methyl ester carboxylesterase